MAERGDDKPSDTGLVKADPITAEVVEAAKQLSVGQININILLPQIAAKANEPEEALRQTRALLELSEQDAQVRLRIFKETTAAIIDAKRNDPDEIDKRKHNRLRRGLKIVLAIATLVTLLGGIGGVVNGASVVLTGLLLVIGVVGIAMLGPLSVGESMSPNDVVQLVNAVKGLIPGTGSQHQAQQAKKRR
jgi:hypothetical protein